MAPVLTTRTSVIQMRVIMLARAAIGAPPIAARFAAPDRTRRLAADGPQRPGHEIGRDRHAARAADAIISREMPLIISFAPTSVPMAHRDTDGQCSQMSTLKNAVAIVLTSSHPEPSS